MRRVLIRAGIVAASLLAPFALNAPLAQVSGASAPALPARVIVKFRASSPVLRMQAQSALSQHAAQAQALGQRIGIALTAGRPMSERSQVVFASGMTSRQLAARIGAESDVEYAVADEKKYIVAAPNDPFYTTRAITPSAGGPVVGQWYLKPPPPVGSDAASWGSTAPAAINAERAWDITTGSASIVVADLDTGIRFDHPDLQGNVIPGYDMVSPDDSALGTNFSSANDGNGRDSNASDPGDGLTSAEVTNNPVFKNCSAGPSSWHGTQTAGLIAATSNNGVGIAGVGPNVRLMPVRVLGKCGGYDSDIMAGMLWAAGIHVPNVPDNTTPARVLNMSLGGTQDCLPGPQGHGAAYIDAIAQVNAAGAVVIVAAGNSGGNAVGSPASCVGAIGVTALRHVGDKVGFSDLGPQITIAAPGGNCVNDVGPCLYPIMTTSNAGAIAPMADPAGSIYTDSFNTSIGTSFSAPLVSGTVALMLSAQPSLTAAQVKAMLQATARPFPTTGGSANTPTCTAPGSVGQLECYCTTTTCGAGMLDAHAALLAVNGVQAAISLTTTTPTVGQTVALTSSSAETPGHTVATYEWTILNAGSSDAVITSATNASSVTVVAPTAAGTFLIQLTTTDNNGYTSSTTLSVVVVAPVVVTPPAALPPATSSGGGGGALGVAWLLLLLTAVLALAATERRERSAPARLSAAGRTSRTG